MSLEANSQNYTRNPPFKKNGNFGGFGCDDSANFA